MDEFDIMRKMRRVELCCAAIAVVCLTATPSPCQTAGPQAQFDVASVKPAKPHVPGQPNLSRGLLPGRYEMLGLSLGQFIEFAHQKAADEGSAPNWVYGELFDIVATMPPESAREEAMLMLRTLLEQRFQLRVHRESRLTEVYSLEAGNGGPKMEAMEWGDGPGRSITLGPSIQVRKSSMEALAAVLSRWMDHKVVGRTGLKSLYNFQLKWHAKGPAGTNSAGSEIFPALQEQLGFKMAARKLPIEFVLVDHVERSSVEN